MARKSGIGYNDMIRSFYIPYNEVNERRNVTWYEDEEDFLYFKEPKRLKKKRRRFGEATKSLRNQKRRSRIRNRN